MECERVGIIGIAVVVGIAVAVAVEGCWRLIREG